MSMSKYIQVYTKHTFSRKVYASMYCAMGQNNFFMQGVVLWCLNMNAYICHAQYIISCSQNILKSENTMFIPSFRYTGYILVYTCTYLYIHTHTVHNHTSLWIRLDLPCDADESAGRAGLEAAAGQGWRALPQWQAEREDKQWEQNLNKLVCET